MTKFLFLVALSLSSVATQTAKADLFPPQARYQVVTTYVNLNYLKFTSRAVAVFSEYGPDYAIALENAKSNGYWECRNSPYTHPRLGRCCHFETLLYDTYLNSWARLQGPNYSCPRR